MGAVMSLVKVSLRGLARGVLSGFDVVRQEVGLCFHVLLGEPGLYFAGVVFQVSPGVLNVTQEVYLSAANLEQPDRGVIVDAKIPGGDDVGGEVWGDRGDAAGET